MQRHVMETALDATLFQERDESRALFQIFQLHVKHMRIMNATVGNRGQFYQPLISQVGQTFSIAIPSAEAIIVDLLRMLKLREKKSQ